MLLSGSKTSQYIFITSHLILIKIIIFLIRILRNKMSDSFLRAPNRSITDNPKIDAVEFPIEE